MVHLYLVQVSVVPPLITIMNFTLDKKYFTTILVTEEYYAKVNSGKLDNEQLMKVIKNPVVCKSYKNEDHPEFVKLRNQLEDLGYIKTERGWWNGDTVLKPFTLNGVDFKKNEQFLCAPAIKYQIDSKSKNK